MEQMCDNTIQFVMQQVPKSVSEPNFVVVSY